MKLIPKNSAIGVSLFTKAAFLLFLLGSLSACVTTHKQTQADNTAQLLYAQKSTSVDKPAVMLDKACTNSVGDMRSTLGEHANEAKYLSLAIAAERCVDGKYFGAEHPDKEQAMQLKALAVMNYVKAGDITKARESFDGFVRQFPQQDLFFSDYSSFVDTATALLNHQALSKSQLMVLNINRAMRDDLVRQYHWLRN